MFLKVKYPYLRVFKTHEYAHYQENTTIISHSLPIPSYPKPKIPRRHIRVRTIAGGDTIKDEKLTKSTSPQDATSGRRWALRVSGRAGFIVVLTEPILTPFPYIAAHVVQAQFIGVLRLNSSPPNS